MRFVFQRGKRPSEDLRLSIDFTNDVKKVATDTVPANGLTVVATDEVGQDVTATMTRLPQLIGSVGYVNFFGGDSGKKYYINMKLKTSSDQDYEHDIEVAVDSAA